MMEKYRVKTNDVSTGIHRRYRNEVVIAPNCDLSVEDVIREVVKDQAKPDKLDFCAVFVWGDITHVGKTAALSVGFWYRDDAQGAMPNYSRSGFLRQDMESFEGGELVITTFREKG